MVDRVADGERPVAVEEEVRKEVNQLEQALRYQASDQAHQCRISGERDHPGFQGNPELFKPATGFYLAKM